MTVSNRIENKEKLSYRNMAKRLSIHESAVKKPLNFLKDKNMIKRIGGTLGNNQ